MISLLILSWRCYQNFCVVPVVMGVINVVITTDYFLSFLSFFFPLNIGKTGMHLRLTVVYLVIALILFFIYREQSYAPFYLRILLIQTRYTYIYRYMNQLMIKHETLRLHMCKGCEKVLFFSVNHKSFDTREATLVCWHVIGKVRVNRSAAMLCKYVRSFSPPERLNR